MNTVTITLKNTGTLPVDATLIESDNPALFTAGSGPGIIQPGESAELDVFFHSAPEPGTYTGNLIIRGGNIVVPLTGRTCLIPEAEPGALGTLIRIVEDTDGKWFEMGFLSPYALVGDAADGWTNEAGTLRVRPFYSTDLSTWTNEWVNSPTGSPVAVGDDFEHWARATQAIWWRTVIVDYHLVCDRHAKDITEITLRSQPVTLPNFPYAMPGDAAQLQTDLRAAGFTGATVTVTAAALVARAWNYTPDVRHLVTLGMSGNDVVSASSQGASISLPNFPYTMPGERAQLQTDLRAAGHSGAVVTLYDDEWQIDIPDWPRDNNVGDFTLTVDPPDPFAVYDFFGNYTGDNPNTHIGGYHDHIRDAGLGNVDVAESSRRGFGRFGYGPGPNSPE